MLPNQRYPAQHSLFAAMHLDAFRFAEIQRLVSQDVLLEVTVHLRWRVMDDDLRQDDVFHRVDDGFDR